ncbi:cytochrome P450 [Luteibacter anthropi]|uniref:Cytochrome P450 n=1 Tax=Luteibacter anthropi TaxID=564369 RepID=A0A7X5UCX6_9GAMM|nr:cytochrome P450 [Luteibacter anthropi]NII08082.1 cytochrome P450 [Luteibacter anthropi]
MNHGEALLHESIRRWAEHDPLQVAATFLDGDGNITSKLTFSSWWRRATRMAYRLRQLCPEDERILLLFESGPDFQVALLACFLSGHVAVPAYPPDARRLDRTLPRLSSMIRDADIRMAIGSHQVIAAARAMSAMADGMDRIRWLSMAELEDDQVTQVSEDHWPIDPDAVAMLQYTSGSTGQPKGVMLSHGNIAANMRMTRYRGQLDEHRRIVTWLPVYHDMGLALAVFIPAACGCTAYVMSPVDFLRTPSCWMLAIDRFNATDTGAPNFALDYLVDRIGTSAPGTYDLSTLKIVLIGAEMVRSSTIDSFLGFATAQGMNPAALMPAYGLAEAVLSVASAPFGGGAKALCLSKEALNDGRVEVTNAPDAKRLVSVGCAVEGVDLHIVNAMGEVCAGDDTVGEVWIAGAMVAQGYRNHASAPEFGNSLAGDGRSWMRTGDLGFIHEGNLYISGRLKDVMVLRGKNYYPQDIEVTAESVPGVTRGAVIAFSTGDEQERVVVVAEIGGGAPENVEDMAWSIRTAIRDNHGFNAEVVLVKTRSIDKTSSGKLMRRACRKRYERNQLDLIPMENRVSAGDKGGDRRRVTPDVGRDQLRHELIDMLAQSMNGIDFSMLSGSARITSIGIDSLSVMDMAGRIESRFGVKMPLALMMEDLTFDELIDVLYRGGRREESMGVVADGKRSVSLASIKPPSPVFCIGGLGGAVMYLRELAKAMAPRHSLMGLQPPGLLEGEVPVGSVEEMAAIFFDEVHRLQPEGPYMLAGHSFGGVVALELARQLDANGDVVTHVVLLDTVHIENGVDESSPAASDRDMAMYELRNVLRRSGGEQRDVEACRSFMENPDDVKSVEVDKAVNQSHIVPSGASVERLLQVHAASFRAMLAYRPKWYRGKVSLFRAKEGFPGESIHPLRRIKGHFMDDDLGWIHYCGQLDIVPVDGDHFSLVLGGHVKDIAALLCSRAEDVPLASAGMRHRQNPREAGAALQINGGSVRFDPFHSMAVDHPYPLLRQLLTAGPVHRDVTGVYWITGYGVVSEALRDKRYSADLRHMQLPDRPLLDIGGDGLKPSVLTGWYRQQEQLPLARLYNDVMLFVDDPQHARLRSAFGKVFHADAIKRWSFIARDRARTLVEAMVACESPDIIRDVARPLPVSVVMDILEIPEVDESAIRTWAHDLFVGLDPLISVDDTSRVVQAEKNVRAYLGRHVDQWSGAEESFMGRLSRMERKGELSRDEVVSNCVFLFTAGFETATAAIGNAMAAMFDHPEQLRYARSGQVPMVTLVDEFLRYDPPISMVLRMTREDALVGGVTIPKGNPVILSLISANRDPEVFSNPDVLDLKRNASRHVAFSHGPHYCIGAALARVEVAAALDALLSLDIEPEAGGAVRRQSRLLNGFESQRVRIKARGG